MIDHDESWKHGTEQASRGLFCWMMKEDGCWERMKGHREQKNGWMRAEDGHGQRTDELKRWLD